MPITTVVRYQIRPEKIAAWESALAEIATRANDRNDLLQYSCGQLTAPEPAAYDIILPAESLAAAAAREPATALIDRLFSAADAQRLIAGTSAAVEAVRSVVLRDRLEISYAAERAWTQAVALMVTRFVVRPGHREAAEELVRKVAEAVPKLDDSLRFTAYQPVIGNMRELICARPVFDLAELDETTPVEDLLHRAFGPAEGGLVYRAGLESMESLDTELITLRRDLSRVQS